jgi:hypothetical protein
MPGPTLADIFRSVFSYLKKRPSSSAVFGSQAVNAYVDPPRMTDDMDILSTDAENLAEEIKDRLAKDFHIATRVRVVAHGLGYRVYQVRKPPQRNRHLIDIRQVGSLPATRHIEMVAVVAPAELVVLKLRAMIVREGTDKGISDKLDIHRMLLAFPEFRSDEGAVAAILRAQRASLEVWQAWARLLNEPVTRYNDDDY